MELEVRSLPIHSVVFGPLGQPQRSNDNSLKLFQRKVQRQRALVLKSMTWLHNTGDAPNADSHFPFWLGPDSPMTTPTSAAAPASSRYIIHAAARFAKGHIACFDFWTRRNNLQNICVSLLVLGGGIGKNPAARPGPGIVNLDAVLEAKPSFLLP